MSLDVCKSDGNTGFPVNIQGKVIETDKIFQDIQASPDVYITFGRSTTRYFSNALKGVKGLYIFDNNTNTEINYNGISYSLISKQICNATHPGSTWPKSSGNSNKYDLILTFKTSYYDPAKTNNPSSFIFVMPIFDKTNKWNSTILQSDVAKDFFTEIVNKTKSQFSAAPVVKPPLQFPAYNELFNALSSSEYLYYQTCIQLRPPPKGGKWSLYTQSIGVCLFVGGLVIDDFNTLITGYVPLISDFRYHTDARNNYFTAKKLPPTVNNAQLLDFVKNGNNWSAEGEMTGTAISTGDPLFTKRFRWIKEGISGLKVTPRLRTTLEYQCVPINKIRDIDGELVLMDPLTGTRALKEELDGSEADKKALADIEASKNSMTKILYGMGGVAAMIVLIVGGSYLVRAILRRINTKSGEEAVAAAAVAATALAAAPATAKKPANSTAKEPANATKPVVTNSLKKTNSTAPAPSPTPVPATAPATAPVPAPAASAPQPAPATPTQPNTSNPSP